MYKTSTFLISLFCKFKVTDDDIRREIIKLYTPLIDTCLNGIDAAQRTLVFRALLPSIKLTIEYLTALKSIKINEDLSNIVRKSFQAHINFQFFLIKKAGLRFGSTEVFDDIMKQVNITEIGCEIGDCIRLFKKDPDETERQGILTRLEVLLTDFNSVTKDNLTIKGVLSDLETINAELY